MTDSLSLPFQMDILADLEIGNEILQRGQEEVVVKGRRRFKTWTCAILYDELSDFEFEKTIWFTKDGVRDIIKICLGKKCIF